MILGWKMKSMNLMVYQQKIIFIAILNEENETAAVILF